MAKQAPSNSMATANSKALDLIGILKEAVKIPSKNLKLMASIFLLVLIPFLSLFLSFNVLAGPFLIDLEDHEPDDGLDASTLLKMIRTLVGLEAVYLIAFCVLTIFAMIMTIYASAAIYTGKQLNLMDVFSGIAATWKRLVITYLCVFLITTAYAFLVVMIFVTFALITDGGVLITFINLLGLSAMLFYLYLASVWMLGLVISVVEEDFCGFRAIAKAVELIQGNKLQGFGLMMLLVLLIVPIFALFSLNTIEDDIEPLAQNAIGAIETVLLCLVKLLTFIVYTVFYYECKKSHGEKVDMEEAERSGLVSNELQFDDSLP